MRLLPKSIHRCRRYPTKFNSGRDIPHLPVEALCCSRGPFEPSGDGVAGMARDPGRCRNAHALDSQARYLVELPSSAAKAAVRCARIRADRALVNFAAVPPSSARLRRKPAVAHDADARLSKVVAPGFGASLVLDGAHHSSVAGLKNPLFHSCSHVFEDDRSTATGASTAHRDRPGET